MHDHTYRIRQFLFVLPAILMISGCAHKRMPSSTLAEQPYSKKQQNWTKTLRAWYPSWRPPVNPLPVRRSTADASVIEPDKAAPIALEQPVLPDAIEDTGGATRMVPANSDPFLVVPEVQALATPAGTVRTYTVRKGDTLISISRRFYGNDEQWKRIYQANKDVLPKPDRLMPGMQLKLP